MPQPPVDTDAADFLDDLDWTPAVRANAVSILNRWARWCVAHDTTVRAARRTELRAYLEDRKTAAPGAATRRKDWQIVRAFYAWAARSRRDDNPGGGLLKEDPMLGVRGPRVSSKPSTRAAKPDEVAAILDAFGNDELGRRNAAMVSLMWRSGLRVGELPGINYADVVAWGETRHVIRLHQEHTKTAEPRLVPVHPETQRYLDRYLRRRGRHHGPLFVGRLGHTADRDGRLTTLAIRQVVERAAARAGVPVSSHQLRRGFVGQYLRDSRGDVLGLEVIGGWADHRMPRLYLADEEADAGIARYFDVVDNTTPVRRLRSM